MFLGHVICGDFQPEQLNWTGAALTRGLDSVVFVIRHALCKVFPEGNVQNLKRTEHVAMLRHLFGQHFGPLMFVTGGANLPASAELPPVSSSCFDFLEVPIKTPTVLSNKNWNPEPGLSFAGAGSGMVSLLS